MTGIAARFDPYAHDPDRWGVSLAQSAELMLGCLDVAGVRSVVEIGAFAGDLTRVLVAWAGERGARVSAIDPSPQPELLALDEAHPQLRLIRATSLASLSSIPLPDAVVIDGDHNHYTVSEELRLLGDRVPGCDLPLLLFHDVCWPHGRRDDYYAPEQIPGDRRRPVAGDAGGLFPGEPGLRPRGGLPYPRSATREGGARNGVLTAVEDFVAGRDELRIAVVPAFFGLGVVWHREASCRRSSIACCGLGTGIRCLSAWRRTACSTWRRHTAGSSSSGRRSSAARVRRRCSGGCWSRVRSRSPSDCRACASALGSARVMRPCPRQKSAGR